MEGTISKGRKIRAAIGVTLILSFTANSTVIISVMNPQLLAGMQTDLVTLSVAMILATVIAFVGSFVGARFIDKITPGRSLLVGVVGIAIVLAGIGLSSNVWQWYIANVFNGIVLAIGAFAAAAGVTAEFFSKDTQTAFGIIGGVSTFVTSVVVILESQLLLTMDYHSIFFVLAVIALVVGLFSVLFLIGKTPLQVARAEAKKAGTELVMEQEEAGAEDIMNLSGVSLKRALKTASFIIFLLAMLLAAFPCNVINIYGTVFFTGNGLSDSGATLLVGIMTMVMGFTQMGSGILAQKKGGRAATIVVFVGYIIGTILFLAWVRTGQISLVYIGVVLVSFIAPVALLPGILIPELFGMKDYTSINAVAMGSFYLGVTIMMVVFSSITESVGVNMAFLMVGVMSVIALILYVAAYATNKDLANVKE